MDRLNLLVLQRLPLGLNVQDSAVDLVSSLVSYDPQRKAASYSPVEHADSLLGVFL